MSDPRYRLLAELTLDDGTALGAHPVEPDWLPAEESLRFQCLRLNRRVSTGAQARIDPVWDPVSGQPYVHSMKLSLEASDGSVTDCELPITYFRRQVQTVSSRLVEEKKLREGDVFHYRIAALSLPAASVPTAGTEWVLQDVSTSPVGGERSLDRYRQAAQSVGDANACDYPVFIPLSVLNQAEALKESARENEAGGVLIGHLWRDADTPEVFAEITALIPALATVATSTKLTFTPESWESVMAVVQMRGLGEVMLGWWHSHPSSYWCKCSEDKQRDCPLGEQFFSLDDVAVHRAVFAAGQHVALVTGDRPRATQGWEMVHSLYGWRDGLVESRGFLMLGGQPAELFQATPKADALAR